MINFLNFPNFRFIVSSIPTNFRKFSTNLYNFQKMPKEIKNIAEIQKQRLKIKQKSVKYSSGIVTLQILGTGAKGAPRSVYLFSDQSRYLFNCGEGTQRLAHEHKTKLAKLEHIFITQSVWKNIGGLPGTSLTIQDVGVPVITLHGPSGLSEIFPATKKFIRLKDLKIKMAQCTEDSVFEDNVMIVKYVILEKKLEEIHLGDESVQVSVEQNEAGTSTRSGRNRSRRRSSSSRNGNQEIIEDNTDYYAHEQNQNSKTETNSKSLTETLLNDFKETSISMCFICRLQPRPGTLDLSKCVDKGVPPGPLLGKLKNREDVQLANGTVVKSSEVCEPDDPGPVFLVVDCPSCDYIESLVKNEKLKKHQKYAENDEEVACLVVHFSPNEVMNDPRYQEWINNFSPSTEHIPVNETNRCMGSVAVHRIQYKLNLLSPEIFPLLGDNGTPILSESKDEHQQKRQKMNEIITLDKLNLNRNKSNLEYCDNLRHVGCLTSYHLRPKKGFDSNSHVNLDPEDFINETVNLQEFPQVLKDLKTKFELAETELNIKEFPKILFLGTGSCIPNKTRNTSGILLQTSASKNILLDCGEGTYGQIVRFFGPEKVDQVLANIDAVYISHLHADHHIGLIGLILGRRKALNRLNLDKDPLILLAPNAISNWLIFYHRLFENIEDEYDLVPNELMLNQSTLSREKREEIFNNLNLSNISTCLVEHCRDAFGVALTQKSGCKITYSGDTKPCKKLIDLGKNSHLLIHEATMEDDLAKEAIDKMHSTTSQAIQVGNEMMAKYTILTHFSQRYAKLPRFNDNFADNVCIAFDNMQIKLDQLPLIPLLYPALKIMFADHYEEMEQKAVKRQLKSERMEKFVLENKII